MSSHIAAASSNGTGTWASESLLSRLKDKSLLKVQGFIKGEWVDASDGSTFEVTTRLNALRSSSDRLGSAELYRGLFA